MKDFPGFWVHLQLRDDFYATCEIAPVPMPVRTGYLQEFSEGRRQLTTELLASELVAWLEESPEAYERYRPALAELAMSVGTEAGKSGDNVRAAAWLERSVRARGDDTRVLVNYAVALVRSGRPGEALTVCERMRTLPMPRGMGLVLLSLEGECQRALAGGDDPESLN